MSDTSGWVLKKEVVSTPASTLDPVSILLSCQHSDGALLVAEYIIGEMKTNIQSQTCETIRYLLDYKYKRLKEWQQLPWYKQLFVPMPRPDLITASALWLEKVYKGHLWDHKPLIRDNPSLKAVAVHRKLWTLAKVRAYRQNKNLMINHRLTLKVIGINIKDMIIFMIFGPMYIMAMLVWLAVLAKSFCYEVQAEHSFSII